MRVRIPARARLLGAGAAVAVIASAAGPLPAQAHAAKAAPSRPQASGQQITITGSDFRFQVGAHGIHAGLVTITFADRDVMPHQAQLFLLRRGVSYAAFRRDLLGGKPAATDGADAAPWGGAAAVAPFQKQVVYAPMQGGTYAVVCFVQGQNGVPHFAMGMMASFSVAGFLSPAQLAALHPAAPVAGLISAHDLTYAMPSVLHSGGLYQFRDADSFDVHELDIARLLPGRTAKDVIAYFRHPVGPPPFLPSGGEAALVPHGPSGWFWLTAAPGKYVAFCLVPDPVTHMPHAAMGMAIPLTVR